MPLHCHRIGFSGATGIASYDGPEEALEALIRRMEHNGHVIVSVSVLRSHREAERYEAFVVTRGPVNDRSEDDS